MKEKYQCPYCQRKIRYFTRLIEHSSGEHICPHCKKHSNIAQKKEMWMTLITAVIVALVIMLFYLIAGDSMIEAQKADGSFFFLNLIFFGSGKMIKWILWELVPFLAFLLISPCFMEYTPQKRFIEQSNTTSIDLSVPKISSDARSSDSKSSGTRKIPLPSQTVYTGEFEEISSSSKTSTATRAFDFNSDVHSQSTPTVNVNGRQTSISQSHRSDAPLKKVSHEPYREDIHRHRSGKGNVPIVPREAVGSEKPNADKKTAGNYSGNRKF